MINPTLYRALVRNFGEDNVLVVKEGEPMDCTYIKDPLSNGDDKFAYRLHVNDNGSGEEFRVSCAFCTDTRQRLYINHRWGVFDKQTNTRNLWLAQCWNLQCLSGSGRQRELYDMVLEFYGSYAKGVLLNKPGGPVEVTRRGAIRYPGTMWRLDDMAKRSPRHPAITYLENRLLDPHYLGRTWGVSFCPDAKHAWAHNRIVAPALKDGLLVGWQARCLGEPPDKKIPKWFTCPGMQRNLTFYNVDIAFRFRTKVIVEGPPDVWGFGLPALGLLGKKLAPTQRRLLVDNCEEGDSVVVLLDPVASPDDVAKGREHHLEVCYKALLEEKKLRGHVCKVYLPGGHDPGELDREYMRDLIMAEAEEQKVNISFKRHAA